MKKTVTGVLMALVQGGLAADAAVAQERRFIQPSTEAWSAGPEKRRLHASGIHDWGRPVKIDRSALASDVLEVDLFDVVLTLQRTAPEVCRSEPEVPAAYAGLGPEATAAGVSMVRWRGRVVEPASAADDDTGQVEVHENGLGRLSATFRHGPYYYELRDDVLVRMDPRRLPPEVSAVRVAPPAPQ